MKLLRQSEPVASVFEGHTSEEAILRARQQLGEETPVRCWKARRGGIFGFFAKESFVAGLAPPKGMLNPDKAESLVCHRGILDEASAFSDDWASELLKYSERTTLSDLVEWTRDEVTLSSDLVPDSEFSDVLCEAEATLNGTNPLEDEGSVLNSGQDLPDFEVLARPERIEGLTDGLTRIGVPTQYQPCESEATLDGLSRALSKLPQPKPIPTCGGSVIVVVGGRHEANAAAKNVLSSLGLVSSEPLAVEQSGAGRLQVVLRQCAKKMTVIVVEAPLRSRCLAEVASWIEMLEPDYVLGAVQATTKRSDIARWRSGIGRIDALAVASLGATATPGELMGELPIAYIDGLPASPLRWVLTLVGSVLEARH